MKRWAISPFMNEVEVFEIRCAVMAEWADYIVVAEGDRTFAGTQRELVFPQHWDRWEPWADKIIYLPVEMPVYDDERRQTHATAFQANGSAAWKREAFLRNAPERIMSTVAPEDFVFLSDADEIVKPEVLEEAEEIPTGSYGALCFNLPQYVMYLNYRWAAEVNAVARMVPGWRFRRHSIQEIVRDARDVPQPGYQKGWHFSYMGGEDRILYKIQEAAHQELAHFADLDHIRRCMASGKDLFKRPNRGCYAYPLDELPQYVRDNADKFAHMLGPTL